MQEEVEQKTMALSVRTARLTAELLQKAFRQFFEAQKNKPQEFKQGKQTLKELMKQNTNISSIEISQKGTDLLIYMQVRLQNSY